MVTRWHCVGANAGMTCRLRAGAAADRQQPFGSGEGNTCLGDGYVLDGESDCISTLVSTNVLLSEHRTLTSRDESLC